MDEREEKCIDYVLRAIETRVAQQRGKVWCPEDDGDTLENARIDAVAKIGDQGFAIEHTMIEPYEGHHRQGILTHKAEADFLDILGKVDLNIGVDIALPFDWVVVLPKQKQRKKFLTSLASLFRSKLGEIKELKDNDRFFRVGERRSYNFDQLAARLRWTRVSFRPPNSLVLFFFHRLHLASIFRGSNAGARRCSMPAISRSPCVSAILFQTH